MLNSRLSTPPHCSTYTEFGRCCWPHLHRFCWRHAEAFLVRFCGLQRHDVAARSLLLLDNRLGKFSAHSFLCTLTSLLLCANGPLLSERCLILCVLTFVLRPTDIFYVRKWLIFSLCASAILLHIWTRVCTVTIWCIPCLSILVRDPWTFLHDHLMHTSNYFILFCAVCDAPSDIFVCFIFTYAG